MKYYLYGCAGEVAVVEEIFEVFDKKEDALERIEELKEQYGSQSVTLKLIYGEEQSW